MPRQSRTACTRPRTTAARFVEPLESRTMMSVAEHNNTLAQAVNLNFVQAGQHYSDAVGTADAGQRSSGHVFGLRKI